MPRTKGAIIIPDSGSVSADRLLTTGEAITEAISQEMLRDPGVFVLGENVGVHGGAFAVTAGLLGRFGPARVMDTPVSETAFVGAAVGAALAGLRPIAELTFVDDIGLCLGQVCNAMAKARFSSGGAVTVPMVLTAAVGGGYSDGAVRSQCLWGTFAHLPGMKVVVPSTAADAKGLMVSAIRDENPVVFLFHKGVLGLPWLPENHRAKGYVAEEAVPEPIGAAATARSGGDLTIVTLALSVHHALDVAESVSAEGVECEVIDLRSLVPLDVDTIVDSVKRTGKLLVVDEDYLSFGVSAEVIARVVERNPALLKSPPMRVCVPDVPIPYARSLEYTVLPTRDRIRRAVLELALA
ncbi:transketolase C-terminal domain-containing protein [Saccharomonospora sp. NPDC006951]